MDVSLKSNLSSNLITVRKSATAREAHKIMIDNWIRHLPVVDETGEYVIGMLSDRDLLRSPDFSTSVRELMSSPVKTFDVQTPLQRVVKAMINEKLSAFIITTNDEISGIVTSEDLLVLLSKILDEESSSKWILSEFLVNPVVQRSINMASQAGI